MSIYVMFIAKGARLAAEQARSAERLRTALEELEDATEKCTQIGQFARNENWDLVQVKAQEVMATCRTTIARWGDEGALKESRNKVLQVATLMRSVVEETHNEVVDKKRVLNAQLNSGEKLSAVVGRLHKHQEQGGDTNG